MRREGGGGAEEEEEEEEEGAALGRGGAGQVSGRERALCKTCVRPLFAALLCGVQ